MILITSANYVNFGLTSEFGHIPPCMLPVQNKRLYEHQYALIEKLQTNLNNRENVYISLPDDYEIPLFDEIKLGRLNISVIKISSKLSLLSSVKEAIEKYANDDEPIRILLGDTLFSELPTALDVYLYGTSEDDYKWDYSDSNNVYSGYFAFSNKEKLLSAINYVYNNGDRNNFTDIIEKYSLTGVKSTGWLDFGLQNTYYRSISKFTTQREFNSLHITKHSVRKYSKDTHKMQAESNWYYSLPSDMKHFAPAIWNTYTHGYEIEYLYLSSLANMYVYGESSYNTWVNIINACCEYLTAEYSHTCTDAESVAKTNNLLFTYKTLSRISKYAKDKSFDLNHSLLLNGKSLPSVNDIILEMDKHIEKDVVRFTSIMHGDFCFSNTLYDFKSQSVKVIDPRGLSADGSEITNYGDLRYDVAKLAHSIIGKYDFIMAGRFEYSESSKYDIRFHVYDNNNCIIAKYFLDRMSSCYNITTDTIYPIMINLFLSMLPLHNDNVLRQKALLANALQLYLEYKLL